MSHIYNLELRLVNRRCLELALSFLLGWNISSTAQVFAGETVSAAAQIAIMETTLTGQSKTGLPLLARMEALETLIYGHPGTGPLKERISQLDVYLGKDGKAGAAQSSVAKSGSEKVTEKLTHKNESGKSQKDASPVEPSGAIASGDNRFQKMTHPGKGELSAPVAVSEPAATPVEAMDATQDAKQNQTSVPNSIDDLPPIKYPPDLQKLMVEAMGFYHSGQIQEAKSSFEHVFSLYPDCVDACFNLGSLAEKRGDTEAAIIYYSHAQRAEPEDEQIRAALFRLTGNDQAGTNGPVVSSSPASASSPDQNFAAGTDAAQNNSSPNAPVVGSNQYSGAHSQAVQNALSTGKSILNYTLNRALSSMRYF